jgi:hypothetical protein
MGAIDFVRNLGVRAARGLDDIGLPFARKSIGTHEEILSDRVAKTFAADAPAIAQSPPIAKALASRGKPATLKAFLAEKDLVEDTIAQMRKRFSQEAADELASRELIAGGASLGTMGGSVLGGAKLLTMGEAKRAEAVGTPFTDGFFKFCLDRGLDGEQVAEMLEKGAQVNGRLGEECKGLLDRL